MFDPPFEKKSQNPLVEEEMVTASIVVVGCQHVSRQVQLAEVEKKVITANG